MKKLTSKQLCLMGLMTAVVTVMTMIRLPVPMTSGYAHLGDAGVFLSGLLLGPMGFIPATLGSAIADFLAGYAIYAPFTGVIKGLMGWAAGKYLKGGIGTKNILIIIALSAFMVAAYFLTDTLLYGFGAAVASVAGNITQACAGIALGFVVLAIPTHLKK